jgi:hypothetical protein
MTEPRLCDHPYGSSAWVRYERAIGEMELVNAVQHGPEWKIQ